ncbi:AraC family transcriptional regulator [Actinocrispum wychmicini]|uniref:AraC-like DNA-binding protein n=1 Tax=Actinocrispum wychmicini TaxID=1213861 RepID=A0A4V6NNS0_9PSEU|nr:helix-turn-helix domain-containing protein [Actinocrispum wychmicini]TCO53520.1 AraC-like DNA-binding protein [Actinocrispum wychmicini]
MKTVFESSDLDEVQEFISAGYASVRFRASRQGRHCFRLTRHPLGPISLELTDCSFEMGYVAHSLGRVGVAWVDTGAWLTSEGVGGAAASHGPGDVFVLGQPGHGFAGRVTNLRCGYVSVEPSLLSKVAATAPGRTEQPVRLTGYRPVSPAAGQHLMRTIAFLRDHVLTDPAIRDAPLVASTAPQLLAATVLTAFPNTALTEPTIEDRHDAHSATLRRAMRFIDDHPASEIGVADIAAAVHVTVRAVQYAFHRQGTTPMAYVRRVRLDRAHRDLLAADPTTGVTVTQIAARWGFFHAGRFAGYYRDAYGRPPTQTLLRDAP